MNSLWRKLILGALLAMAGAFGTSAAVRADDDYWVNHWRWYDNSYRPYYHRNYYGPYYGGGAYGYGPGVYYGGSYSGPYYRSYYYPGGTAYYPGNQVQVGPLRFGWW